MHLAQWPSPAGAVVFCRVEQIEQVKGEVAAIP